MPAQRIAITGYPHLSIAPLDEAATASMLRLLRAAGFTTKPGVVSPPEGANGKAVIAALTHAYREAAGKG